MKYVNSYELHEERAKRKDVVKRRYAKERMDLDHRLESALDRIHDWFEFESEKLRRGK